MIWLQTERKDFSRDAVNDSGRKANSRVKVFNGNYFLQTNIFHVLKAKLLAYTSTSKKRKKGGYKNERCDFGGTRKSKREFQ
ncbi:MAG: hypothetical protein LT067_05750 [Sulfurovum sp.]|nr:hypothetical protein [Sulfurovum sp.]